MSSAQFYISIYVPFVLLQCFINYHLNQMLISMILFYVSLRMFHLEISLVFLFLISFVTFVDNSFTSDFLLIVIDSSSS